MGAPTRVLSAFSPGIRVYPNLLFVSAMKGFISDRRISGKKIDWFWWHINSYITPEGELIGVLFRFYGISTFIGYSMLNVFLYK